MDGARVAAPTIYPIKACGGVPVEHCRITPIDYRVPQGLDLADLHAAMNALGNLDVIGVELAELQSEPDGSAPDLEPLLTALSPLVERLARS